MTSHICSQMSESDKTSSTILNTRQKDALVFFWRASPDTLDAYNLADLLAGGPGLGRHPAGAELLITKLASIGYVRPMEDGSRRWAISTAGRDEARRIIDLRRKAGRALVLIERPPVWALPRP